MTAWIRDALGFFREIFERHHGRLAIVLAFKNSHLAARIRLADLQDSHGSPVGHHEKLLRRNQKRQPHIVARRFQLFSLRGSFFIYGYQSERKFAISAESCAPAYPRRWRRRHG